MKKKILFILFICLTVNLVFSNTNQEKIDSILINVHGYIESVQEIRSVNETDLLSYLSIETEAMNKAKIYNALCWKYFTSDPPKAMKYAKLQYAIAENLKDEEAIVNAYDNLAWLYQGFSNHKASVKFMLKALKIKERMGDKPGVSVSLSGLANNYYSLNNFQLALNYFNQTLAIERLAGRELREASTLNNIGLCYVGLNEVDKGLETYLETVKIYMKNKQEIQAAGTYSNIGLIYLYHKNNYVKALFYLKKAAKYNEQTKKVSSLSLVYGALSKLYTEQNDFANALIYGEKAVKNAELANSKIKLKAAHKILSLAFYNNGNYQFAYDHFKIAYDLKDTIFNVSSSNQIAEMQTKYDTEKKEAENQLLIAKQKLDQAKIDKKSAQQNMLLIALAFILFVVGYVFYSLQRKKKINKLLYIKNDKISAQKDVIEGKNKDITDSINYAQRIQDAILPDLTVINKSYTSFVYYRPKDVIGGDFYWVKDMGNKIFFSVVDCTGHGVPGALMSMIGHNSLNKIVKDLKIEDPGKILDELNMLVNRSFDKDNSIASSGIIKDGMDISICVLDKVTNKLEYAGANNSLYLYRENTNRIDVLAADIENDGAVFYETKANKMKVGGGKNKMNYRSHTMQLQKNDTIYLFSDGYADQFGGEKGRKFMYKPFKKLLLSLQSEDMSNQAEILDNTINEWKGNYDQVDDICIMGVRV